ncbi:MAG: lytic transglycosylase domain-containing protein [Bacteroidales bacterium]|nr:lytic transglycosylase domain-containing protein [Bacteroidales bacterium]
MKKISVIALLMASLALAGEVFIFATHKERSPEETHTRAIRSGYHVYAPPLPDTLTFCGERVPMNIYYVRESLDRELVSNMYYQSNTLFCIKRATRVFPTIERILRQEGVPLDMKYLCVIESGLLNATSPAGAQGYWQFMKTTGQHYGLEITDEIDMRNDLEASTRAACRYLKDLKRRFGGWAEAAAAYNCGENGLAKRLDRQMQRSYYDLYLNRETQRYVYRILAMKLIMSHPQDYGYHVRRCDTYPELPCEKVKMQGQNIDLYQFAQSNGTSYKMLRTLNPWITTDNLKNKANKTYTVLVPTKKGTEYNTIVHGKRDATMIERL